MMVVYEKIRPTAELPKAMTAGSAGYDLFADLAGGAQARLYRDELLHLVSGDVTLEPGDRALIPLGFKARLPLGTEAQIRPRSGLAIKHGVTVVNSPGTIDSDYAEEWMVALINLGTQAFVVKHGDRIAQAVLAQVASTHIEWREGPVERTTERAGGFGSTDLKV